MLLFLAVGVLACWPAGAAAQDIKNFGKCPVGYGYQGPHNFSKDTKARATIEKLDAIPREVRSSILKQLTDRVGSSFTKRLKLDYGYLFDFDKEGALKPNDISRIDAYDLVFKVSDRAKGLKAFWFKVVTDGTGKLIEDVALPDIASEPKKSQIVSCNEARNIAAKNGFPLNRTSIYFVYDWDSGSFTWMLSDNKAVEPDEPFFTIGRGTFRKILIQAHTGKVLRIFKETIIV